MINHPSSWPRKTVLNDVIMSSKDSVRTQKLVGLSEINMIALVRGDQGGASFWDNHEIQKSHELPRATRLSTVASRHSHCVYTEE